MPGPEYKDVELPFIQQLQGMGWEYIEGSVDDPAVRATQSDLQNRSGEFQVLEAAITGLQASLDGGDGLAGFHRRRTGHGANELGPADGQGVLGGFSAASFHRYSFSALEKVAELGQPFRGDHETLCGQRVEVFVGALGRVLK